MLSPAKLTAKIVESSIGLRKNFQSLAGGGAGSSFETPAAGSATPRAGSQTTGTAAKSNPSGSGTSTSGGKDANGDAGRDKMPDSDRNVRPMDQQPHPQDR